MRNAVLVQNVTWTPAKVNRRCWKPDCRSPNALLKKPQSPPLLGWPTAAVLVRIPLKKHRGCSRGCDHLLLLNWVRLVARGGDCKSYKGFQWHNFLKIMGFSISVLDSISFSFNSATASGSNKYRVSRVRSLVVIWGKVTSVFLAAACWRSLGRLVASGERLYRHTALPSRGVVSLDPWARSWALADLPLVLSCACRELLGGATKREAHPCEAWCPSWGGAGSGLAGRPASRRRQGGRALLNLGSRRGVGPRRQEGFVCASSPCNQADVDSLGFLSSAQIGASLSQQTQSVTVMVERHLRDVRCCGCPGNRWLWPVLGTAGCAGEGCQTRVSPPFCIRLPEGPSPGCCGAGWEPGPCCKVTAGSSIIGWRPG